MKNPTKIGLCVILAVYMAGCSVPRRDTLEKKTFLLKVEHPEETIPQPITACFNIRMTRVAPAFSGSQLVYRTGPVTYEQDYYNAYLSTPDEQLNEIVKRWFRDSRQFVCHTAEESGKETITFEPHLDELYADFQGSGNPSAVAQMHFYLSRYDQGCGCPVEILKKSYAVSTPLPSAKPTPEEVVAALSQSVEQILLELEQDLVSQLKLNN
jgi:uncharacterized lipoprotein YmbA